MTTGPSGEERRMPIDRLVGQRLRELRSAYGLSIREFGDAVGASVTQLAAYESGRKRIPPLVLMRCADRLGVTIQSFFKHVIEAGGALPPIPGKGADILPFAREPRTDPDRRDRDDR